MTINNSFIRLVLAFYSLLEWFPAWSAERWTIHHSDWLIVWLIDWLSRVLPPVPLCPTWPHHSPRGRCHLHPTEIPLLSLLPEPQTDSSNPFFSFWWLLHRFCSGFTSSRSTEGKAAKWRRFHSSATPQSPFQCLLLTHPNIQNNPFSLLTALTLFLIHLWMFLQSHSP